MIKNLSKGHIARCADVFIGLLAESDSAEKAQERPKNNYDVLYSTTVLNITPLL
ncbi:MAG: hypothetical protein ACPG8W_12015 [Candidatus Promineifilaceae bacterium]